MNVKESRPKPRTNDTLTIPQSINLPLKSRSMAATETVLGGTFNWIMHAIFVSADSAVLLYR